MDIPKREFYQKPTSPKNKIFYDFIKTNNFYVVDVTLTNDKLKLYRNIKPLLVDKVKWDENQVEFIGSEIINGKKKTRKVKSVYNYFNTYVEASQWYDNKINEAQKIIKEHIDKLIVKYNSLEDEKINIRSEKLERIIK